MSECVTWMGLVGVLVGVEWLDLFISVGLLFLEGVGGVGLFGVLVGVGDFNSAFSSAAGLVDVEVGGLVDVLVLGAQSTATGLVDGEGGGMEGKLLVGEDVVWKVAVEFLVLGVFLVGVFDVVGCGWGKSV